jgi:hypothetical protein
MVFILIDINGYPGSRTNSTANHGTVFTTDFVTYSSSNGTANTATNRCIKR